MSYIIIRSITVVRNTVYRRSVPNNVYPRDYPNEMCPSLTKILQEEGRDALDKAIMHDYWSGQFQGGSNDYVRALKLFHVKYPDVTWRNTGEKLGPGPYNDIANEYTYEQVNEWLLECLKEWKARDKAKKYAVKVGGYGWIMKLYKRGFLYSFHRSYAKLFDELEAKIIEWRYRKHPTTIQEVNNATRPDENQARESDHAEISG